MKQKPTGRVLCNALYLLFDDLYENMKESTVVKMNENDDIDYGYGLRHYYKATKKEDLIRDLWNFNCQNLLSGVLIYLYKTDPYFSPKLNTMEQFFIKVYRNREILTKIGLGEHKVVFPFENLINKKKVLLIRC